MQVGHYIINPRYIQFVRMDEYENAGKAEITIELCGGDQSRIVYEFPDIKSAEKVLKYIKRNMSG